MHFFIAVPFSSRITRLNHRHSSSEKRTYFFVLRPEHKNHKNTHTYTTAAYAGESTLGAHKFLSTYPLTIGLCRDVFSFMLFFACCSVFSCLFSPFLFSFLRPVGFTCVCTPFLPTRELHVSVGLANMNE